MTGKWKVWKGCSLHYAEVVEIEKVKHEKVRCPYCGHPVNAMKSEDAKCKGIFFKCKNKIIDSVLSKNPLLHTDKADKKNHGKGISIVKSIAKKYGGDVVISEKNNEFIVSVILDNRIFT